MSVPKTFDYGTAPSYQREAIDWLKQYRNTQTLQEMLMRFRFSKEEIALYRKVWATWLKPKMVRGKYNHA